MEQKFLLPVLLLFTILIGCERVGYDSEGEEGMIDTLCGTTWERSYKVKDYSYKEQYTFEKTGKGNRKLTEHNPDTDKDVIFSNDFKWIFVDTFSTIFIDGDFYFNISTINDDVLIVYKTSPTDQTLYERMEFKAAPKK